MKKYIISYVSILCLVLFLSGLTFYLVKKYNISGTHTAASIFPQGSTVTENGYIYFDYNNGNGTCWRGIYLDNGTPVALYQGTWASGTGECRLAIIPPRNNTSIIMSSMGTTSNATATTGEDYFRNELAMELLQLKLVQSGVLPTTKVTGTFTPDTFLAIKAFQTKYNLPVTGYLNTATVQVLNNISFTTTPAKRVPALPVTTVPTTPLSIPNNIAPLQR